MLGVGKSERIDRLAGGNPGDGIGSAVTASGELARRLQAPAMVSRRAAPVRCATFCRADLSAVRSADIATAAAHWADYKERQSARPKRSKKPASRSARMRQWMTLRRDRKFAAAYLDQSAELKSNRKELMLGTAPGGGGGGRCRKRSAASPGLAAGRQDLNATTLYRTLSGNGNPELNVRCGRCSMPWGFGCRSRLVQAVAPKTCTLCNSRHAPGAGHRSERRHHCLCVAFSEHGIEVSQLSRIVAKIIRGVERKCPQRFL